ncbi:dihydrofolate reductase family protein [Embleya sp. NPDC005971]|uniref:dihydrofolate reductase family protein n=1 Tax=Embleya sp. NPDC005971 TaxID=3156724 RepID=UPI00340FB2DE
MSTGSTGNPEETRSSARRILATHHVSLDGVVVQAPDPAPPPSVDGRSYAVPRGTTGWDGSVVLDEDLAVALGEFKRRPGKDIDVSGSVTLTRSLLRAGLVDDLHLLVLPVVLGSGQRLFAAEDNRIPLTLVGSTRSPLGVLHLHYRPG